MQPLLRLLKEIQQLLNDRNVLEPKNPNGMSSGEKHGALQYLMFVKQMRNGAINQRPQMC